MFGRGRKRNIYAGPNSIAGIPMDGKVDQDFELLRLVYATAYDSLNNVMLSHAPDQLKQTTLQLIRGRFRIIKMLVKRYAPHELPVVEEIEDLSIKHQQGKISDRQYLQRIRRIVTQKGLDPMMVNLIEARINQAEMAAKEGRR